MFTFKSIFEYENVFGGWCSLRLVPFAFWFDKPNYWIDKLFFCTSFSVFCFIFDFSIILRYTLTRTHTHTHTHIHHANEFPAKCHFSLIKSKANLNRISDNWSLKFRIAVCCLQPSDSILFFQLNRIISHLFSFRSFRYQTRKNEMSSCDLNEIPQR